MENQKTVKELYSKLGSKFADKKQVIDNTIFWGGVDWETIHDFLFNFRYHRALQPDKMAVMDYLKEVSNKYPIMDVASISLKKEKPGQSKFALDDSAYILCQERAIGTKAGPEANISIPKETPDEAGYYVTSKQRVASCGAEIIGLSPEKIKAAQDRASEDGANIADKHYRFVRVRPLLMVYALDLIYKSAKGAKPESLVSQVPAIGMAFPDGDYDRTVTYVVNKVWLQLHKQESFDTPDDEEDYDE